MVARPPVRIVVDRMKVEDLPAVHVIERESFSTPWPAHAYRQELESNRLAHYVVARWGDEIVGFAGMWMLVDEAHITTFATRRAWRRQGIGERLLLAMLDLARARGAAEATLEVRPSNTPARRLYEKYGFKVVGVRPRYYSDNNEDALIMTTEALDGRAMRDRIAALRAAVAGRPDIAVGPDGLPISSRAAGPLDDDGDGRDAEVTGSAGPEAGDSAEEGSAPSADASAVPRMIRPSSVTRRRP
ncbi:MAG: ribosomal protein S18-alanine N-acetyltransferase [Candidatus Limnocylindrales bacterium]|jgi:ribosomal-protein-alanine N-acetyltransferase